MGLGGVQDKCIAYSGTNFTGAPPACYDRVSSIGWRFMGPGLGGVGGGVVLMAWYSNRLEQNGHRLKELREIGARRGWKLTLKATSWNLAYRW